MANDSGMNAGGADSQAASSVGQTANIGRSTSVAGGAAKVFREFKWGLLTLFLLMVVVIGLVYDGGKKKKAADLGDPGKTAATTPDVNIDPADPVAPPTPGAPATPNETPNVTPPAPPTTTRNVPPVSDNNDPMVALNPVPPPPPPAAAEPQPYICIHPTGLGEAKPIKTSAAKKEKGEHTPLKKDEDPNLKGDVAKDPKPAPGEHMYVVQNGDTLTKIATHEMGGKAGVKAILEANRDVLSNPNKLRVGMNLKIPAAAPAVQGDAKPKNSKEVTKADRTPSNAVVDKGDEKSGKEKDAGKLGHEGDAYVVQSGDTLERIARKLFNDGRKWRSLYEWNREQIGNPSQLRVGQTLKIKEAAAVKPASSLAPRAEADVKTDETTPATMVTKHAAKAQSEKSAESKNEETPPAEVQACSSSAFAP